MATKDKLVNLEVLKTSQDFMGEKVADVKGAYGDAIGTVSEYVDLTAKFEGGYIATNKSVGDDVPLMVVSPTGSYTHAVVDCAPGDVFQITVQGNTTQMCYCFIDSSGKCLENGGTGQFDFRKTAPANATKLVVNDKSGTPVLKRIKGSNEFAAVKHEVELLDTSCYSVYGPNLLDESKWELGNIDNNGVEVDVVTVERTGFIPVDPSRGILYFIRTSADPTYALNIRYYTSQKVFDSREAVFSSSGSGSTALTKSINIPATAAYFRLTATKARSGNICVSYDQLASYVPYQETKSPKAGTFNGKKIVLMGDSIFGNFSGDYGERIGIGNLISRKTGATVINCAFGGSRMAYRHGSALETEGQALSASDLQAAIDASKEEHDPTVEGHETDWYTADIAYACWNELSGVELARAIAAGSFAAQTVAAANIVKNRPSPYYFVERVAAMADIPWNTVDYIVWNFGTNDFATEVKLADTTDTTNLYAYDNAYRTAIEAILTAYPNIRIIPVTPGWRFFNSGSPDYTYIDDSNTHTMDDYEGTSRLLTAFLEKAQSIAREYQLPCIDNYYTLGANRFTRLGFFDYTDGTHPNTEGRERIAEHIASQLDSVV